MLSLDERRAAFFSEAVPASPPLALLPPRGFHPAHKVVWARPSQNPHHIRPSFPSGAQLAGLRYEKQVKEHLVAEFGASFVSGPWWEFFDGHRRRFCQPDGTLRIGNQITLVEVKLRWTADAWWQLQKLYLPVAQRIFPDASEFTLLTITRSFDPAVPVPPPVQLLRGIGECPLGGVGVLVWRGRPQARSLSPHEVSLEP